jgi:hypothetical protein
MSEKNAIKIFLWFFREKENQFLQLSVGITVIGVDEVGCAQQVQSSGDEMKRHMTSQDYDHFMCRLGFGLTFFSRIKCDFL